jgi:DNA-directed RNA polymerase subunit RPC12/RpoP
MEDVALQLGIDIDRRTTRGRACPRCGGKIIPSRRAVYQSTGDPNAVFPAWQCERCGYEELVARPIKAAPKHGAKAAENKAATAQKSPSAVVSAGSGATPTMTPDKPPAARAVPALKDSKGRNLPHDVNRMMAEMNKDR